MLSVFMLNVANKPYELSAIMLNAVMLSVVMLNAVAPAVEAQWQNTSPSPQGRGFASSCRCWFQGQVL